MSTEPDPEPLREAAERAFRELHIRYNHSDTFVACERPSCAERLAALATPSSVTPDLRAARYWQLALAKSIDGLVTGDAWEAAAAIKGRLDSRGVVLAVDPAARDALASVTHSEPTLDVERLAKAIDAVPGLGFRMETGTCMWHGRLGCRQCRPVRAVDATQEQATAIATEYGRLGGPA